MGRASQAISLVDQQVNSLASFQNLLNVLAHDVSDVVDLGLDILEGVFLASFCRSVLNHQLLEIRIERSGAI